MKAPSNESPDRSDRPDLKSTDLSDLKGAMAKLPLRTRLFFSHLTVMGVAIIALAAVSRLYTPRYFVVTLERMEGRGIRIQHIRGQILEGFEDAWGRGMFWSIALGGTAAGGISYLLSRRIIRPLTRMENITQKFATGDLAARVPPSEIPELNQLGHSFNQMATDLENVEHQRRELISDLTHELRTPLTIVKGYLEGLADNTLPASPQTYSRMIRETTRLQRLVDDLQELSKLEAGHLPINSQPCQLKPLLEQIVQRFDDQLLETDPRRLLGDWGDPLPQVYADVTRVEQILVNLLSNALRYTTKGYIKVRTYELGGDLWIAIEDTGIGIAQDDLPHVFERFWRADRSRSRHLGGTGIGLAISKYLVERQGGRIKVNSELNVGSTFSFSLPKFSSP